MHIHGSDHTSGTVDLWRIPVDEGFAWVAWVFSEPKDAEMDHAEAEVVNDGAFTIIPWFSQMRCIGVTQRAVTPFYIRGKTSEAYVATAVAPSAAQMAAIVAAFPGCVPWDARVLYAPVGIWSSPIVALPNPA